VNGLFLRERTKTSRNVTISFSQSPERATATRGRVPLVYIYIYIYIIAEGSLFHSKNAPYVFVSIAAISIKMVNEDDWIYRDRRKIHHALDLKKNRVKRLAHMLSC
jgi:hypothetical protein